MILKEELHFREADVKRGDRLSISPFRRKHLLVKCDGCGFEWWAIKSSFVVSRSYSKNNSTSKDYCKSCRWHQDVVEGIRRKPRRKFFPETVIGTSLENKRSHCQISSSGYKRTWVMDSNHPRLNKKTSSNNGGRVYEHILVMEKVIGRYLKKEECVHHIDGNKLNNQPDNLYLCANSSEHALVHNKMEKFLNRLICDGIVIFNRATDDFEFTLDVSLLKNIPKK